MNLLWVCNNVDWFVDDVIKFRKNKFYVENINKCIIIPKEIEEYFKNNKNLSILGKKYKFYKGWRSLSFNKRIQRTSI